MRRLGGQGSVEVGPTRRSRGRRIECRIWIDTVGRAIVEQFSGRKLLDNCSTSRGQPNLKYTQCTILTEPVRRLEIEVAMS